MFNKKRIIIFFLFILLMFFMMMFGGTGVENAGVATRRVIFTDGFNNKDIADYEIEVGKDATVPDDPYHKNHVFTGWYQFDNHKVRVTNFKNIIKDTHVIALYEGDKNNNGIPDDEDTYFDVTFVNSVNNDIIKTESVLIGMDATLPKAPKMDNYTFTNWNGNYKNVKSDRTVRAMYEKNGKKEVTESHNLTIDYINENGTKVNDSYNESITRGKDYSVTSPKIKGYTPDKSKVTGTMGNMDITEVVEYSANTHMILKVEASVNQQS